MMLAHASCLGKVMACSLGCTCETDSSASSHVYSRGAFTLETILKRQFINIKKKPGVPFI